MISGNQPRTVERAAEELGLSQSTVRAWIAQRRIGFVRLGRSVRIPAHEIQRLLDVGFVPASRKTVGQR
jgi:excisionase family DNA binding protein